MRYSLPGGLLTEPIHYGSPCARKQVNPFQGVGDPNVP
ncbi:hypothetical protein MEBOL_003265 [Melittangium boletus DSM 14713]|uniref:Uncharacterized protein n=1 Tax=Melittangium boletus DSM 14713 TaxID=1294270 RepID=A0A250IF08_9BACT|nr:hypothetical protein MEBOL_003265 [Melittangium boletus DSM 14713]